MPIIDGGVILQAGIGAGPRGVADLLPQLARLHRLCDLAGLGAPGEVPVAVRFHRLEKLVGDAHRVVGVLTRDGEIGFRIPISVVDREVDVGVALLGKLDDAPDIIVGNMVPARRLDLAPKHRIFIRVEAVVARSFASTHAFMMALRCF